MTKATLGSVIKDARDGARMTQRELASAIGVKASHVAYLENGRRRPSLSLLSRIADTLELDKKRLFLLAHPEAQWIVGEKREASPSKQREDSWRRFAGDRGTLARHKVTERELKVLKNVNMLGRVSGPNQYLFILNAIRQAVDEE